jgi:AcrR family transcriptional regulator
VVDAVADLEGTVGAKSAAAAVRRPRQNEAQARGRIMKTAAAEFARHGFAGARVARIVKNAGSNPRMLYHYFGSKSALYVAVLENALGGLRTEELRLDVEHFDPLEGLLQLFDFMNSHFEQHRDLVTLLTAENLLNARYMRKSARIRDMSSPVLEINSTCPTSIRCRSSSRPICRLNPGGPREKPTRAKCWATSSCRGRFADSAAAQLRTLT